MGKNDRIWMLCRAAALDIYGKKAPSDKYARSVAELLFGTAAHESGGFRWHRQRTPKWDGNAGGFSKWQLESVSIRHSIEWLKKHPDVNDRATQWLFRDPRAVNNWYDLMGMDAILWSLRIVDNDRLAVLFARIHYLRVPEPVPESLTEQAAYWKKYYNTAAGKGTAEQYIESWKRYCAIITGKEVQNDH